MSVRERILMLRLMDKLQKHPSFAKALGVEANRAEKRSNTRTKPKGLTDA